MKERSNTETPSSAHMAEAAAWVAHLHNRARTPDSDRGHRLWLKEAPARQKVWEVATDVWEDLRRIPTAVVVEELEATRHRISRGRRRNVGIVTGIAAAAVLGIATLWMLRDQTIVTDVGEQRTVSLKDRTQVTLNTATRITVHFDDSERRIEVNEGEVLFDVARHANWPFVVVAGNRRIEALGTAFMVRRDEEQVSVVLVNGKVSVSESSNKAAIQGPLQNRSTPLSAQEVVLVPGQRLTFNSSMPPKLDQPSIEKLTAWRRGKVVFDGVQLSEAISEMNRYSTQRLAVEDPRAANLHISGVFKYGDSVNFATAVAATYQLRIIETADTISIVGVPEHAYR